MRSAGQWQADLFPSGRSAAHDTNECRLADSLELQTARLVPSAVNTRFLERPLAHDDFPGRRLRRQTGSGAHFVANGGDVGQTWC